MRKEWKQWQVNENPLLIIQTSKSNFRIMQIAHYCNITCMHVAATSETLKEIDNTIDRFLWIFPKSKILPIINIRFLKIYPIFLLLSIEQQEENKTFGKRNICEFSFSKINLIWNSLRVGGAENLTRQDEYVHLALK